MKKRVRLYKAQEGGMPDANMLGYPGGNTSSQEVSDKELAQFVLTDIQNSEPTEKTIMKLVTIYGKDPMEAEQFVSQIAAYAANQEAEAESEDTEDEEEVAPEEEVEVEEEEVEEESSTPTGTQMSNSMILEDEEVDESDLDEGNLMRYGGYPMAQDGMEVPIQMPDVSAYLPQDMGDYLGGTTNPYSGLAWDSPEETENVSEDEQVFSDYTEPELPEERFGGMPSKRSYVNSVLKLVKKQMGGDSAAPESAKYNDDNADPTGANVRKKSLDKFIGSVKDQSNMALAKQQAEQQYEQMMQQQQMMQQYPMAQQGGEQDNENPMHHLALFSQAAGDVFQDDQNGLVEAQFGGLFGRRRMRNRMQQGMPMIPGMSMIPGMPPITRMDVRKSGWLFNRPKEYSIEFGAFSPMPGMSMPGLPATAYGYTSRVIKTPAKRIKVEAVAATVNKEAIKEVSNATPNSTATTKAAESAVTTTVPNKVDPKTGDVTISVPAEKVQVSKETKDDSKAPAINPSVQPTPGAQPTPVVKEPEYGSQEEEFCYPNGACYEVTKDQRDDNALFQELPSFLSKYNAKHNKNWISQNAEGATEIDLSKVTLDDLKESVKTPYADVATNINEYENTDEYLKKWLEFQQKNQQEYGDKSFYSLRDRGSANRHGERDKHTDWLNVSGAPGTGGPNDIWTAKSMLRPKQNKQFGGSLEDPFNNPYGELQKFIGGGDEDFTQGDLDDVYSKDTANGDFPMAQWGGVMETLFPANIMPRRYGRGYSKMRGVPYDPRTKMPMPNFMPGPGGRINKIDVTKSNWLTGAPKKYTVTYGQTMIGPSNKPGLPNSGTTTPQSLMRDSKRTDIPDDLSLAAKMAINRGDRQTARNDRRLARHPEYQGSIFTPEQLSERKAAKETYINAMKPKKPVSPSMTSDQVQNFATMVQNPTGLPDYEATPQPRVSNYKQRNPKYGSYSENYDSYMDFYNSGYPTEEGMVKKPAMTKEEYFNAFSHYQDGGDLKRFLPQAQVGQQSPVTYSNNPAVAHVTEAYFDKNNQAKQGDFTDIFANYAAANKQDASGGYQQETSVDYEAKKGPGSTDPEAMVNVANAGIQGVTGLFNRAETQRAGAKMADNLTADNLYASDPSLDRGDYDTNSGLYRLDEMGQKWNSRSKQYGGDVYQDGGMVEGDEVDMTEEEIAEFIANGGEVEYL